MARTTIKVLSENRIKTIFTLIKNNFSKIGHRHDNATTSADGYMSSTDKAKLDGIAEGANNYTHPAPYTAKSSGLYKIATNAEGHVTGTEAVQKSDIIGLGISEYTHPTHTERASGLYKITVDGEGHVTDASAVVKADITGLGIPASDTTYEVATTARDGLMSSTDKSKLDGIAEGANNYSHPTHTAKDIGFYKVKVDGQGHVSSTEAVAKSDITALGIPAQDTTYDVATTDTDGLMSSTDKSKLDGIAEGANNYTLPQATTTTLGGVKVGSNISVSSGTISVADGTTAAKGVVQLSTTAGDSTTTAATPKLVQESINNLQTSLESRLSAVYTPKGSIAFASLPTPSSTIKGHVYNITDETFTITNAFVEYDASNPKTYVSGTNVVCINNGTEKSPIWKWDVLAGTYDLSGYAMTTDFEEYTEAEIQAMWDSVMA